MKKTLLGATTIIAGSLTIGCHALSFSSGVNPKKHTKQHSLPPSVPAETDASGSSRRVFMASSLSLLSTISSTSPANASWFDVFKKKEEEEFTYDNFKNLVQTKKIRSVQFSWDGSTLTCVDAYGKKRSLEGIPNDPTLLLALVDAGIEPVVDEFPFEKRMSSVGWFRDKVLDDESLTDEEKYKYRGYKTFRQNIPENRVYIPSNLISN